MASYVKNSPYFGALIGRYGNRIGGAKFSLDGTTYSLAANDGPNTLHGGLKGFDKRVWTAQEARESADGPQLVLHRVSTDGEEGFPGNLDVTATFTLTQDNALAPGVHRDDRQGHRRQFDSPWIFQPGRKGGHSGPHRDDSGGPFYAGGLDADPDGRVAAG